MSFFRYSPAFRLTTDNLLGSTPNVLSTQVVSPIDGEIGNWTTGFHEWRLYPSRTAALGWTLSSFGYASATISLAGFVAKITVQASSSVHAYMVFHRGPDTSGAWWFQGIYEADGRNDTEIRIAGGGGVPGVPFPTGTAGSWTTDLTYPLGAYQVSGDVSTPVLSPRSGRLERIFIPSVTYEDLSPDPEREDMNLRIRRRERGVRCRVEFRALVAGGSDFEFQLFNVYCTKLLWPSLRVFFTLNFDQDSPTWREVSIVGNLPRNPFGGRNLFSEVRWTLVCVEPLLQVPAMVVPDGRGAW